LFYELCYNVLYYSLDWRYYVMRMQVVRNLEGDIVRIFDLDAVECVEVSDCGREIWVFLKSGKSFTLFELNGHSEISVADVMEKFIQKYKAVSTTLPQQEKS